MVFAAQCGRKYTGDGNTDTHSKWLLVFINAAQKVLPSILMIAPIVGIVWEGDSDLPRPV